MLLPEITDIIELDKWWYFYFPYFPEAYNSESHLILGFPFSALPH
jgi:hypothetical protein